MATVPSLVKNAENSGSAANKAEQQEQIASSREPGLAVSRPASYQSGSGLTQAGQPAKAQKEQDGSSSVLTNWIQALSAAAIVWLTLALVSLESRQTGLMGGALKQTTRATRAMRKSNKIAKKTIGEASRIGEAQVRAYLSITPLSFKFVANNFHIKFRYVNSGQSPARLVNFDCRVTVNGAIPVTLPGVLPVGDVAANAPATEGEWVAPLWDEAAGFVAGPEPFVVWIIGKYEDVFERPQSDHANFVGLFKPGVEDIKIDLLPHKGMKRPQ